MYELTKDNVEELCDRVMKGEKIYISVKLNREFNILTLEFYNFYKRKKFDGYKIFFNEITDRGLWLMDFDMYVLEPDDPIQVFEVSPGPGLNKCIIINKKDVCDTVEGFMDGMDENSDPITITCKRILFKDYKNMGEYVGP